MSESARTAESREAHRINTMLAATALVGSQSWTIRVRNISSLGALVESAVRLNNSTSVTLKRGELSVVGNVVWSHGGFFGVKFLDEIDESLWVAIPTRTALMPADDVHPNASEEIGMIGDSVLSARVAEELAYVGRVINGVAASLSEDPILRMRHCGKIQELAMSAELLKGLGEVIASDDRLAAIQNVVPGPARQRLLRQGLNSPFTQTNNPVR